MLAQKRPTLHRQLFSNQLWETIAFIAKAIFMIGLTPWMLHNWGPEGYGEFALASSAFVLLSLADLGLRGRTRVALSKVVSDNAASASLLSHALVAFAALCLVALVLVALCTSLHIWSAVFGIDRPHENIIFVVTTLTLPYMFVTIALEPCVARGHIGLVKLANALGWMAASLVAAVLLWRGASVTAVVAGWIGALLVTALGVALLRFDELRPLLRLREITTAKLCLTYRDTFSFTVSNVTWAAKTHAITFVLASVGSVTVAGTFFICLRMAEIISALGAVSFDVALVALPASRSAEERASVFYSILRCALVCTVPCALIIVAAAPLFFTLWLKAPAPFGVLTGMCIAAVGFSIAASRFLSYTGLSLGAGGVVARCGIAELTFGIAGTFLLEPLYGLKGTMISLAAATFLYLPVVIAIRKQLYQDKMRSLAPSCTGELMLSPPVRDFRFRVRQTLACPPACIRPAPEVRRILIS